MSNPQCFIPGTTSDEMIDSICDDVGNAALSKDSARLYLNALRERVQKETCDIWNGKAGTDSL